jgi:hypothetical protein
MRKTVALDANLLVLLAAGLAGVRYIAMHRRLQEYTQADYELLTHLIAASAGVVVTPNALSEASNFLRQIKEPARSEIGAVFRALIQKTDEIYIVSEDACVRGEFLRLGLADAALLEVAKRNIVILSVDLDLYLSALNAGYEAVNFNHVREQHAMVN